VKERATRLAEKAEKAQKIAKKTQAEAEEAESQFKQIQVRWNKILHRAGSLMELVSEVEKATKDKSTKTQEQNGDKQE
jgi:hypothetical protein